MIPRVLAVTVMTCMLAACASLDAVSRARAPKGYIVAEISVTDAAAYEGYRAAVAPMVARFGGSYLVRGGEALAKEGAPPAGRIVVIEFDSLAAARAFYESPAYAEIAPLRLRTSSSRVFLVEGAPAAP